MCGRFAQVNAERCILEALKGALDNVPFQPTYNLAPSQQARVIIRGQEGVRATPMTWGLIPAWAKEKGGRPPINARVESVAEKPTFREAFRFRRCLVPADGFYEWTQTEEGRRKPFWIRRADGGPMALAGLWERWQDPAGGETLHTFAILTTRANPAMGTLHHRMPLMLGVRRAQAWLDPATTPAILQAIIDFLPADDLAIYAVNRQVNSPKLNEPACLEVVGHGDA